MYISLVTALMLVVPLIFVVAELLHSHSMLTAVTIIPVIAKWYVFWAVGVRLGSAGLRQMVQPRYTAKTLLGINSEESLLLVRELGFANTAIGGIGMATLLVPSWVLPTALLGAIFYGLAGLNHLLHRPRNKLQNVAMVSDLFAG